MKQNYFLFVLILSCLIHGNSHSQIVEVMAIEKPIAIDFNQDIMYVALNSSGGSVNDGSIVKLDLTDPNLTTEILDENLIYPRAICLVGDELYYSIIGTLKKVNVTAQPAAPEVVVSSISSIRAFTYKNGYLYFAHNNQLSKIDLSQENPSVISIINGFADNILSLAEYNNELFFAHGYNISKIDLSNPNPTSIDVFTNLECRPYGLDFYNNELYIDYTWVSFSSSQRKIVKCDITQENLVLQDVVDINGFNLVDLKFKDNDLYIVHAGFGNKISKVEDADTLTIDDFIFPEDIILYPNPTEEFISLANLSQSMTYSIIDVNGKKVKSGIINSNEPVLVKELNSGLYFINFDGIKTFKFMKK